MRNYAHALNESETSTHITSLVVHARPEFVQRLSGELGKFAEVDVHTADQNGKLVVLMETTSLGRVTELIEQINVMEGVVGATLVYHQIEDSVTLDQPVDDISAPADSEHLKEPAA